MTPDLRARPKWPPSEPGDTAARRRISGSEAAETERRREPTLRKGRSSSRNTEPLRAVRCGVEVDRKAIHLLSSALALITFYAPEPYASAVLSLIAASVVAVDFSRLRLRRWALAVYRRFPFVFRADERKTLSGASVLALGIATVSILFPARPATAGVLCVVWGDAAAAVVGQAFQNRRRLIRTGAHAMPSVRRRGGKTVVGTLGCLIVSMVMVFLVVGTRWDAVIAGAAAAALLERWTPGRWDNLSIPIGTALAVHAFLEGWLG